MEDTLLGVVSLVTLPFFKHFIQDVVCLSMDGLKRANEYFVVLVISTGRDLRH